MPFDLAQVNVSRLLAPLDSPLLAEFIAALDEVNAEGDAAPGFLWRLQTEDGNATAVRAFGWDVADSHGVIVNLTTWTSVQTLGDFVFSGRHLQVMRQRRQWFQRTGEPMTALWWVPSGHRPSTDEAEARVRHLRADGPTLEVFTFRSPFPRPTSLAHIALRRRLALPSLTDSRAGSRSVSGTCSLQPCPARQSVWRAARGGVTEQARRQDASAAQRAVEQSRTCRAVAAAPVEK